MTFDTSVWQGGNASISWNVPPPFTFEGTVINQEDALQTDIKTREVLTWPDGRPRRKVVLTLADKDGALWDLHVKIPSALFAAIKVALVGQDVQGFTAGDWVAITYDGDEPATTRGLSPTKQFTVAFDPGKGTIPDDPFADNGD